MDTFQAMKHTYKVNAFDARELRRLETKFVKRARKDVGNYPKWDERRLDVYKERMAVRWEQRYLHLARAFYAGKNYHDVENSVRENNEVNTDLLYAMIRSWDITCTEEDITTWVEGEL